MKIFFSPEIEIGEPFWLLEVILGDYHLVFLVAYHSVCWICSTDLEVEFILEFSGKCGHSNSRYSTIYIFYQEANQGSTW